MKKKFEEIINEEMVESKGKKITRGEALRKTGYIAVSAATLMILLGNPGKAHAASPAPPQ